MRTVATQVDLPSLYNNHVTSNISEGWTWSAIGTIVELNPPKPPKDALAPHVPVTFIPMPAVDAYDGTIATPEDRPFGSVRKGYTSFRENDVIFAKITPCMENGKAAIARGLTNGFGFGSTEFHVLRSTRAVIPEYVFYYIRQESFRKRAEEEMTGSVGQRRVPVEFLRNALMLLPPLAEQKRIVAKVEQLLARVNAARKRLAKIPVILKRFRQSVLAAACSGRLTADWREKNSGVESAKALVKKVLAEQKNALMTKNRSFDLKTLREKLRYCQKDKEQFNHTIDVPAIWLSTSFYNLCILQRGFDLPTRRRIAGPFPIVSSSGVSGSHNEFKVRGPCVYVGRSGSVGKTFYLESDAWPLNTTLFVKEFNGNYPKFVYYYLSFMGLERFSSSTAVPTLNRNTFTFEQVQIPPLEEQEEIVNRVESLFGIADRIEARYQKAEAHVEKLTQAILAKAFRGELVPTEAELAGQEGRDYEPASVLLERIKAERKALEKEKRTKKQAVSRGRRYRKPAKATATESECAVTADTSEATKGISTDSPSSSHRIALPPVSNRGRPTRQKNTSITAKKHGDEALQCPVALSDLQTDEVMAVFRKACRGRGAMSREELLKEVSLLLGYQRVASAIQERLKGNLRAAIRRKIIGTNCNEVRLETKSTDDYDRNDLVNFLGSVMRLDKGYDREEVIRALANYLGFRRLTEGVLGPINSAINSAIRQRNIVASGSTIRRIL